MNLPDNLRRGGGEADEVVEAEGEGEGKGEKERGRMSAPQQRRRVKM
jgi:hypothetical protein